jgi:AcrR family transcriptional regulator
MNGSDSNEGERKGKGERTRTRILDAAEREFSARGFQGARLATIGTEAACPAALIHHYFSDKRSLYDAVVTRSIDEIQHDVSLLLAQMQGLHISGVAKRDQYAFLETLTLGFVRTLGAFYMRRGAMLIALERDGQAETLQNAVQTLLDATATQLEALRTAGIVRTDVNVRELCVFALARIAVLFGSFSNAANSDEETSRAIFTMLVRVDDAA